tara:strand:- start:57 stop:503 length:447 start_codon:yes stop_codon:yes gene_type:complete
MNWGLLEVATERISTTRPATLFVMFTLEKWGTQDAFTPQSIDGGAKTRPGPDGKSTPAEERLGLNVGGAIGTTLSDSSLSKISVLFAHPGEPASFQRSVAQLSSLSALHEYATSARSATARYAIISCPHSGGTRHRSLSHTFETRAFK